MSKVISFVLFVLLGAGAAFAQTSIDGSNQDMDRGAEGDSAQRHRDKKIQQSHPIAPAQTVCANQVPRGWIRTNDRWDPTTCGKPTAITYNVWTIEQYRGRPVGSIMRVCSDIIPRGWVMIDSMWNPTVCGHPTAMTKNVMTIKRVE